MLYTMFKKMDLNIYKFLNVKKVIKGCSELKTCKFDIYIKFGKIYQ